MQTGDDATTTTTPRSALRFASREVESNFLFCALCAHAGFFSSDLRREPRKVLSLSLPASPRDSVSQDLRRPHQIRY
jgi:hypothetical protein